MGQFTTKCKVDRSQQNSNSMTHSQLFLILWQNSTSNVKHALIRTRKLSDRKDNHVTV